MRTIYIIKRCNAKHITLKAFSSLKELCLFIKRSSKHKTYIYTMNLGDEWQHMDITSITKRLAMLKKYYDRGSSEKNPENLWTKIAVTLNKCWRIYRKCTDMDAEKLQVFFMLKKVNWEG